MAGSGLNAGSVTPSAFTVSGNSVTSVSTQGNSVYLTLASNLAPDAQPSITIASGSIMDKAGNAYGGGRIAKAGDGLGPNLSLSESGDLSDSKVTVTIATDEQLGQPTGRQAEPSHQPRRRRSQRPTPWSASTKQMAGHS